MALGRIVALTLVVVCGGVTFAQAQSVRSVLGSGGTTTSAVGVVLQGTVGQAIAGLGAGAGVRAGHGFWSEAATPVLAGVDPPGAGAPARFALGQATPSPSRGAVRFAMTLPGAGLVELSVFDAGGRRLGETSSRHLPAGAHRLDWSSPGSPPGVYFARFAVNGKYVGARRLVLTR